MRKICIIPARSGSKGLADKNMLFMDGKPLIFHTIDAALDSGLFAKEDIFVTTDSLLYGEIIQTSGVSVVYRNEKVSNDVATTFDVLKDFFENYEENVIFILLQPTSPLRNSENIRAAYKLFEEKNFEGNVVSFTKTEKNPRLNTILDAEGIPIDIIGIDRGYRRQDSNEYFAPNGAIFISKRDTYLEHRSFFTEQTSAYIMTLKESIDIDGIDDFYQAVGSIFFDYKRRELKNKSMYTEWYKSFSAEELGENWFLGDSRSLGINLKNYTNLSIGGVTLVTVKENIDKILEKRVPNKVFISLGVNDLITKYTINKIKNSFLEIIEIFKEKNVEIIFSKIVPVLFTASVSNKHIYELNQYLDLLSQEYNFDLLKPDELLAENGILKFAYTEDGLHFNEIGQSLLSNYYKKNLIGD